MGSVVGLAVVVGVVCNVGGAVDKWLMIFLGWCKRVMVMNGLKRFDWCHEGGGYRC